MDRVRCSITAIQWFEERKNSILEILKATAASSQLQGHHSKDAVADILNPDLVKEKFRPEFISIDEAMGLTDHNVPFVGVFEGKVAKVRIGNNFNLNGNFDLYH